MQQTHETGLVDQKLAVQRWISVRLCLEIHSHEMTNEAFNYLSKPKSCSSLIGQHTDLSNNSPGIIFLIKYLKRGLIEDSPMPFLIKAMGQQMAEEVLKTITLKDFPFCNLLVSSASYLCAEEKLGLCYDLEEFQSMSHPLCVKILIWLLFFQQLWLLFLQ